MLAGNATANLARNLWSFTIIFCDHFPEGTHEFTEEECENETRGQWYYRQMLGSANLTGGKLFHILAGNLSHQIEHHMFPDLPAHRYAVKLALPAPPGAGRRSARDGGPVRSAIKGATRRDLEEGVASVTV